MKGLRCIFFAGSDEITELLIEIGANVNVVGPDSNTPIILASRKGRKYTLKFENTYQPCTIMFDLRLDNV